VVVILYVDDILVLSELREDRQWVRSILVDKYEKVTCEEGERLPYLGMTIVKRSFGYKLCMKSYIDNVIKFYGKEKLREYIIPATNNFFKWMNNQKSYQISQSFIQLWRSYFSWESAVVPIY
jgi:hypothetical protein